MLLYTIDPSLCISVLRGHCVRARVRLQLSPGRPPALHSEACPIFRERRRYLNICCTAPAATELQSTDQEELRCCGRCSRQYGLRHFKKNVSRQGEVINYAAVCAGCVYRQKQLQKLLRKGGLSVAMAEAEIERLFDQQPDQQCSSCEEWLHFGFYHLNYPSKRCRTCLNASVRNFQAGLNYPALESRTCTLCHQKQAASQFRRDKNDSTGLKPHCRDCSRIQARQSAASIKAAPLHGFLDHVSKQCSICAEMRPLTEFHVSSRQSDGRTHMCKNCGRKASLDNYHRNKSALRNAAAQ